MIQYWTLAFLTLTGLAYGQKIIIPPADTTAVVGSNISFFCRVGFGPIETMSWEFNEAIVYSLQDGYEHYPCTSCGNKYTVTRNGGNFTLHVNALDLNDGGKYTCIAMVPSATAVLIVLDTPKISKSALSSAEGSIVEYTCKAQFAMPPKSEVLPKQNPVLGMFLAETTLNGVVREGNCDGLTNCYFFTQTEDLTLEASMNGKQLMCDISTSQPSMHVNNSTMITVQYSVRNISYTPGKEQYDVGNNITCIADGNPKPQYVWDNMNQGESNDGQTLYVTEEMLGANNWRCTAENSIDGNLYKENIEVDFTVKPRDYREAGNASLGIGLGVTFAVCVLVIILTLLYCHIKRKETMCHLLKKKKDKESQSQPDKSSEGNERKEKEMKASTAAMKDVSQIFKHEKENNADSAESTKPLLPKENLRQKSQNHVEESNTCDTTPQVVLSTIKSPTINYQKFQIHRQESPSPWGEKSPAHNGREVSEIHASDVTQETTPLLPKNEANDNDVDVSRDDHTKQLTVKPLQDQDIQDSQCSDLLTERPVKTNIQDAYDVEDGNSKSQNSKCSNPVPENVESRSSDREGPNAQNNEDNQSSKSGNSDGSPSKIGEEACAEGTKTLSEGTPEDDGSNNHSPDQATEDDARTAKATISQPQGNTEATQPIPYDGDMLQSEKIPVSPTDTEETGNELEETGNEPDEADMENHSTKEGTYQPLGTVEETVKGASQPLEELELPSENQKGNTEEDAIEISDQYVTRPDSPTPPSRQTNQEIMNIPSDRQGNFGVIEKGSHNGMDLTLFKCEEFQTEAQRKAFTHGGNILEKYEHENIAKLLKLTGTEKSGFMVMEYECGGVLQQFLQEHEKDLKNFQLIRMCEDILQAMIYLEKQPCIHRALAACNCLVGENNIVKIWNFSFAIEEKEYNGDPQEEVPIGSASLEALKDGKYSLSSDVWSFGVLMWEVFSHGKTPYGEYGKTKEKLLSWLERGSRLEAPKGTPQIIKELIKCCCKGTPTAWPSLKSLQAKLMDAR